MRTAPRPWPAAAFLAWLLAIGTLPVSAQSDGITISTPAEGDVVAGVVTIAGNAVHPSFEHYEISFGFEPNPTDTWFHIGQPSEVAVADAALVEWDTTVIADGVYMLRLQVFTGDDVAPLEFVARGIVVQNSTPTPSPSPAPPTDTPLPSPTSPVVLPPTATVAAAATYVPVATQAPPAPVEPDAGEASSPGLPLGAYGGAFCRGVGATFVAFFLLWLYGRARAILRPRLRRWIRRTLTDLRRP